MGSPAAGPGTPLGPSAPDRRHWRWLLATAAVTVATLVVVLIVGGGRPRSVTGLPDAGPLVGWLVPLSRLAADTLGVLTVGLLAAAALLLPLRDGRLDPAGLRCVRLAGGLAAGWCLTAIVQIVLTLAEAAGHLILGQAELVQYTQVSAQGSGLLAQVVLTLLVAVGAAGALSPRAAAVALVGALAALTPPALAGHSSAGNEHMLATTSLLLHLVGAALWVGTLAALVAVRRWSPEDLPVALRRFSPLALGCLITVGLSGVLNAAVRLGSPTALVTTSYGGLVLAKAAALVALGLFGWQQRRRILPTLDANGSGRAFGRLAAAEVSVMLATVALAVGLSRTPTPVPDTPATAPSPASELLGYDLPPAPSLGRLLLDLRPDAIMLAVVLFGAALYLTGLRSLRRRGDAWPVGRTAAWFGALAVLLVVTNGGINRYAPVLFSVHMIQHMALNMVVPILGVMGAPITLALRTLPTTSPRGGTPPRQALLGLLHSRLVRVLTSPLVASALFVFSLYGLYFSGLFEAGMRNHWGHLAMQVHFLASGGLFFWVLVGIDPAPRRLPHAARLPLLFVVMVFHAFFGVVLLSGTSVIAESYFAGLRRTWGRSLIDDQQYGGGIAWSLGEPVTLLVIIVVVLQWLRADEREARRFDRAADRAENRAAARAAAAAAVSPSPAPASPMSGSPAPGSSMSASPELAGPAPKGTLTAGSAPAGSVRAGTATSEQPEDDPLDDELAAYNARLAALHRRTSGRRPG